MGETTEVCIPEGVVMEILSWLLAKSLVRFKCVSKTWCQWFSTDSVFINLHLDRSKNRNINPGIIVKQGDQIYFTEDPTTRTHDAICFETSFRSHDHWRLYNVCNGLVCLTDGRFLKAENVYVWNPFTGDHIVIPAPPSTSSRGTVVLYGLGFHRGSNEYKILLSVTKRYSEVPHFESDVWVYTLGTHSWRNLGDIMDYEIHGAFVPSTTMVNSALHWIRPKRRPVHIPNVLVSFDFGNEIFQEIPQPNYGKFDGGASHDVAEKEVQIMYTVGELSGLLCIFRNMRLSKTKMEIWVMKEYGVVDSWSKQFVVPGLRDYNIPIGVAYSEEIIIPEYKDVCQFILYNPKTNSIRGIDKFGFRVYDMSSYTGSLLSPTMINGSRHSST